MLNGSFGTFTRELLWTPQALGLVFTSHSSCSWGKKRGEAGHINAEGCLRLVRLAVLACIEVHHVRPGTAAAAEAMTVHPRCLAGLWPWLLMAALQVVLGQPGLESDRQAHRAVIKVALLNHELSGKPITLEGLFVGGSAGQAEGKLMQVRCPSTHLCLITVVTRCYLLTCAKN